MWIKWLIFSSSMFRKNKTNKQKQGLCITTRYHQSDRKHVKTSQHTALKGLSLLDWQCSVGIFIVYTHYHAFISLRGDKMWHCITPPLLQDICTQIIAWRNKMLAPQRNERDTFSLGSTLTERSAVIHALSLVLLVCISSMVLDFFSCSFSSPSTELIVRLWICSSSYMAFRAGTAFRPVPSGEVASIYVEERPSEESSCGGMEIKSMSLSRGYLFGDNKKFPYKPNTSSSNNNNQ